MGVSFTEPCSNYPYTQAHTPFSTLRIYAIARGRGVVVANLPPTRVGKGSSMRVVF